MGRTHAGLTSCTEQCAEVSNASYAVVQLPSRKNEDRFIAFNRSIPYLCDCALAVLDGHNGHSAAESMQLNLINTLRKVTDLHIGVGLQADNTADANGWSVHANAILHQTFAAADALVCGQMDDGSTCTLVLLRKTSSGTQVKCAWVGDSRAVVFQDKSVAELSHDHRAENPLEQRRVLNASMHAITSGHLMGWRTKGVVTSEEMDAVASVSRLLRKKGAFTAAPISPASPGARTWRERRPSADVTSSNGRRTFNFMSNSQPMDKSQMMVKSITVHGALSALSAMEATAANLKDAKSWRKSERVSEEEFILDLDRSTSSTQRMRSEMSLGMDDGRRLNSAASVPSVHSVNQIEMDLFVTDVDDCSMETLETVPDTILRLRRFSNPHTKHIEKEVQKAVSDQNARFLMSDLAGDLVSVKVPPDVFPPLVPDEAGVCSASSSLRGLHASQSVHDGGSAHGGSVHGQSAAARGFATFLPMDSFHGAGLPMDQMFLSQRGFSANGGGGAPQYATVHGATLSSSQGSNGSSGTAKMQIYNQAYGQLTSQASDADVEKMTLVHPNMPFCGRYRTQGGKMVGNDRIFLPNGLSVMCTRCIGDRACKSGDGAVTSVPDIADFTVHDHQSARIVVATDGLWDVHPADKVAKIQISQKNALKAATKLTVQARENGDHRGIVRDDITVIVIDIAADPGASGGNEVTKAKTSAVANVSVVRESSVSNGVASTTKSIATPPRHGQSSNGWVKDSTSEVDIVHVAEHQPRCGCSVQ